jgi:uncharacterized protein YhfF
VSLKPLKKSDLSKSWIKPRRDKVIKMPPEFHLIVTEGTDTEPLYFQRIKEIINLNYKGKIEIEIHGEGDNTLSLFEKAHRRALASPKLCSVAKYFKPPKILILIWNKQFVLY